MRVLTSTSTSGNLYVEAESSPPEEAVQSLPRQKGKIALPTLDGIYIESIDELLFLKAEGNYNALHFQGNRKLIVCKTLRDVEAQLDESEGYFFRVHRSFSVNLDRVRKYIRGKGGQVVLDNGATLDVSVSRKQAFCQALSRFFA
jgi:two-component system LytT family response regulator